jgi:hypothetical protein
LSINQGIPSFIDESADRIHKKDVTVVWRWNLLGNGVEYAGKIKDELKCDGNQVLQVFNKDTEMHEDYGETERYHIQNQEYERKFKNMNAQRNMHDCHEAKDEHEGHQHFKGINEGLADEQDVFRNVNLCKNIFIATDKLDRTG